MVMYECTLVFVYTIVAVTLKSETHLIIINSSGECLQEAHNFHDNKFIWLSKSLLSIALKSDSRAH